MRRECGGAGVVEVGDGPTIEVAENGEISNVYVSATDSMLFCWPFKNYS